MEKGMVVNLTCDYQTERFFVRILDLLNPNQNFVLLRRMDRALQDLNKLDENTQYMSKHWIVKESDTNRHYQLPEGILTY